MYTENLHDCEYLCASQHFGMQIYPLSSIFHQSQLSLLNVETSVRRSNMIFSVKEQSGLRDKII